MRFSVSPKFGKSAGNALIVALLASAASGCSSDVTRFGGLFSSSGQDQITTNSIPRRSMSGLQADPVPQADMQGGAMQPSYANNNNSMNQPYPSQQPAYGSSARMASAPVSVQRSELAAPGAVSQAPMSPAREKQVALAQPFPGNDAPQRTQTIAPPKRDTDTVVTGSIPRTSGWSATNAPSVTMRPGESIAILANRYGVPEKEVLRANGLKTAAAAKPGQIILIPTFNGGNAAKASTQSRDLAKGGQAPQPTKSQEQNLALIPTGSNASRDKSMAGADQSGKAPVGAGPKGAGGTYVVKSGDSLAKIAKATGNSVDDIKAANDLTAGSIRIGQELNIPNASAAATDTIKTASIQPKAEPKPAAQPAVAPETAAAQPASYKAPAATESVSDVAKKEVASAAPEATGIGKYRWPARGAVIAAYGANVNGSRNDGIDISVPQGTPIKAAENGVVIYAGNGLKELGNTVLVRHDDGTVTVYGNADTLSVTRGQKIQRGQTVAVSGMSGNNVKQPQVHFEVRKDATPVNPMTFLE